jgi:4-phytase / acid phosphatase
MMNVLLLSALLLHSHTTASSPTHVIVISRHGVRTPYSPTGGDLKPEAFRPYSTRWKEFPVTSKEWGVPTIEGQLLTDHGKVVIAHMGKYFSKYYANLLSDDLDCERDLYFYADNCTRDVQTATEFLSGLSTTCYNAGGASRISQKGATILFNQGAYRTETCTLPPRSEMDALLGGSQNSYSAYRSAHSSFVQDIQDVIDCCSGSSLCDGNVPCTLGEIPTHYQGEIWGPVNGPVYLSGYFASYFTLAALNNMSLGLPNAQRTLSEITSWYHESGSTLDVVDGAPSSPSFASTLASHIIASLQQSATGKSVDALAHGPDTKFVYMAGHDTNLVLLRTLLDLTWLADGWKRNDPAPGGMLVFELYAADDTDDDTDGGNDHQVEIFFQVATPKQIRNAETLNADSNPPSRTPVLLPGCRTLRCPLTNVTQIMLEQINNECVLLPALQTYVNELAKQNEPGEAEMAPGWAFIVGAVGLVLLTAAIVAPLTLFFVKRSDRRRDSGSYLLGDN